MSGRASNKLAETLSAGADEEFELVLKALAKVVEEASVELRDAGQSVPNKPGKTTGSQSASSRHVLLEQLRRQTERAAS